MNIKVIIHKAEEGGYWAEVPALPGCVSEGDTLEEIKANIREAISGYLEVVEEDNMNVGPEDEVYELTT